ncbi:MAG: ferredoxin [Acidimicrobiia bacterium]
MTDVVPETDLGRGSVLRTKADCLRICEGGPIAVVYPDCTWYRAVDEAAVDRIVDEHLVAGTPVASLVFATDGLRSAPSEGQTAPGSATSGAGS